MMVSLYKMGVQFPEGELSRAVGFHIQPWGGDTKTEPGFIFLLTMHAFCPSVERGEIDGRSHHPTDFFMTRLL